jgi:hypothetical protein
MFDEARIAKLNRFINSPTTKECESRNQTMKNIAVTIRDTSRFKKFSIACWSLKFVMDDSVHATKILHTKPIEQ